MYPEKRRSEAWFLLPIFFRIIVGLITYFIRKQDDPVKAKNGLYLGIVLMVAGIILNIILAATISAFDSGF